MKTAALQFIGYASGIAARDHSSCMGPLILQDCEQLKQLKQPWYWIDNLYPTDNKTGLEALLPVAELNARLAKHTYQLAQENKLFATIGGDHSCAIGTWSGVAAAVSGPIGLLWIDAHMDSHTPETSPSMNIHGMPLAALLGYGPNELTQICNAKAKILPEHICLLGVRSFEAAEEALLKKLGVRIYFMPEIEERGLAVVMAEALKTINQGTVGYGVSIDVDGIDPADAPGVDTRAEHGMRGQDLKECLKQVGHYPPLLGLEFAEFNPKFDIDGITAKLIVDLTAIILEAFQEQDR
jgi:arginase